MSKEDFAELISRFQKAVLASSAQEGNSLAVSRAQFSGEQQMQAYINAYNIRLGEVLEKDFPALLHYLGHQNFSALVQSYIEEHPSRHYNLNHFGLGFANHLVKHSAAPFAIALAQLEETINRVYLMVEDAPALTLEWLQQQSPDYLLTTPLLFRPAFELLALSHDSESYLTQCKTGQDPLESNEPVRLAICRYPRLVKRHVLCPTQFTLLTALKDGHNLLQALDEAQNAYIIAPEQLQTWLAHWITAGFFQQQ